MNVLFVVLLWLLGHDSTSLQPVLYAIPFSFLLGLYRFRPGMLYVNVRRRILGDVANGVPFSCLHVELSHDQEDRLYRVYLKGNGNSGEAAKDRDTWKRLVWESITETEATAVAEEFRVGGVGTPDPIVPAVRRDKHLRWLAHGGHLLSVAALIAFLWWMTRGVRQANKEPDLEVVLRAIQIIIAFLFLSVLPLATYLFRLGRGAMRCRQMPPPAMRIIWDMKLIEGDKAVTRGRRMAVTGLVLIVIGLVGGLYVPYTLGSLYGEPLRSATRDVSNHR